MYVELKNINKTYGSYQASRNVNFGIEKGKLIGLLGPSGSGKTTIHSNDRRSGNPGQRRSYY